MSKSISNKIEVMEVEETENKLVVKQGVKTRKAKGGEYE